MLDSWLTWIVRSPSEHLKFVLDSSVYTFEQMGIKDPNRESSVGESSDGRENDPLLPRPGRSEISSDGGTSDAGCLTFLSDLVRSCWGFQRWKYSSLG